MAAKRGSLRRDLHLRCTGAKYRPAIIVAEQAIRCPLHVQHFLGMRPDTAEKPETCLDEQRRLDEALGPEIVEIVKVRSEEHTSELQSLMRISYAVFCLKKKKENKPYKNAETVKTIINR